MGTLGGHVAWITGASSGIGRACAFELAKRGATVALSGRREEKLAEVVDDLRSRRVPAQAFVCDVTDEDQVRDTANRVADAFDGLHVALANAGYSVGGTVEELTGDDWRRQLDVNVVGAALTARHALPHLMKTRGRLAFTGSVAGFMPAPGWGAYHASKYALRALGETLSAELEGTGVTCTTLHPGFVESDIMKRDERGRVRSADQKDPRPGLLMWSADKAAQVMVDAIVKRKRSVVFTGHGKIGAWLGQHFPSVMHAVMASGPMVRKSASFGEDT